MNNYDIGNFLPLILLVIVFFLFAIIGCLELVWDKIKSIFFWFWNPDFGFVNQNTYGCDQYGRYHHQTSYTPYQQKKKCIPHLHKWVFDKKERHNWQMIDGKPFGTRNHIENVIKIHILVYFHPYLPVVLKSRIETVRD